MKGNTIVRKMKKLTNIVADCMEAGQEMEYHGATRKEFLLLNHKIRKAEKAFHNIWKRNVPAKPRKTEEAFFSRCDTERVDQCVSDWRDEQEVLLR